MLDSETNHFYRDKNFMRYQKEIEIILLTFAVSNESHENTYDFLNDCRL